MSRKRFYIHIGFGKTGTSAIQALLSRRRNDLLGAGFLYPNTGLEGNGHHGLAKLDADNFDEETQTLFNKLNDEAIASGASTVIISSENFTFAKLTYIEDLKRQLADFDVKIVFYVRPQETLIESTFLHKQKVGDDYQGCLESFFRLHCLEFDFMRKIRPWVILFGDNAIVSRLYDKNTIGNDVCLDFANLVGLPGLNDLVGNKENPSLRPEFSSLVRMIDAAGIPREDRVMFINNLQELSEYFNSVEKKGLTSESLVKEISIFYRESNIEFAEKFLPIEHAEYWKNKMNGEVLKGGI